MKHVFDTRELAHLWMHQSQSDARNAGGNFYFDGDTIYSYGSHFPIARHITNKRGERAILFTTRTYSVTTSKHITRTRQAIAGNGRAVYHVRHVNAAPKEHIADYISQINETLREAAKARTRAPRLLTDAAQLSDEVRAYAQFVSVRLPKLPAVPGAEQLKDLRAEIAAQDRKLAEKRTRAVKVAEKKRAEAQAKAIAAFRAGEPFGNLYGVPVMLRVNGDEVETSLGARVPLEHARRGLKFVNAVVASGTEYERNGHTLHLGNYPIDRITVDGTLYAGCHVISYEEITRIAEVL